MSNHNLQRGFIVPLLLALIALLLLAGGAYVYMQKNQAKQTVSEIADWKTYTNSDLGFEFQYPPSFGTPSPRTLSDGSVSFNDQLGLSSKVYYNQSTGQPMTVSDLTSCGSNKKQIIVDGKSGIEISSSQIGTVVFVPLYGSTIFSISSSLDRVLLDKIISTFKFNP